MAKKKGSEGLDNLVEGVKNMFPNGASDLAGMFSGLLEQVANKTNKEETTEKPKEEEKEEDNGLDLENFKQEIIDATMVEVEKLLEKALKKQPNE